MNKSNHKQHPNSKQVKKEEGPEIIWQRTKQQDGLEVMRKPQAKEQARPEALPRRTKKSTQAEISAQQSPRGIAKRARQCEHIMVNGEFCRALALRGRKYCYFHLVHIGRRLRAERVHEIAMAIGGDSSFLPTELPLLEDANSIQMALSHVIDDVLHNRLDNRRAGLVLYALQTARSNLANGVDFSHKEGATVAHSYDDFEEDYQLGETAPEMKAEQAEEEQLVEQSRPHEPEEGSGETSATGGKVESTRRSGSRTVPDPGLRTVERAAPSQRLATIPAAHLLLKKPPVFAFLPREEMSGES